MSQLWLWVSFAVLFILVGILDRNYNMLKDASTAVKRPYSFSRVQLAWWSVIILASFIAVLSISKKIPELDDSTWILLGISGVTTAAAGMIDVSDRTNQSLIQNHLSQNQPSQGFILDILSDANGVSVHRFQSVVFNISVGVWFVWTVNSNLGGQPMPDPIIPHLTNGVLALLGVSSGTYAVLKTTENK